MFDTNILQKMGLENCEIVRACGDSMEEVIKHGSLCFIDITKEAFKNGKIYAINTRDGVFVK